MAEEAHPHMGRGLTTTRDRYPPRLHTAAVTALPRAQRRVGRTITWAGIDDHKGPLPPRLHMMAAAAPPPSSGPGPPCPSWQLGYWAPQLTREVKRTFAFAMGARVPGHGWGAWGKEKKERERRKEKKKHIQRGKWEKREKRKRKK